MNYFSNYEEDLGTKNRFKQRWPIILKHWPRLVNPHAPSVGTGAKLSPASAAKIQDLYNNIVVRLRKKHSKNFEVTIAEKHFGDLLSKRSKLKVYHSTWIGNRCIDHFLPQVNGYKQMAINGRPTAGLVVEVDGDFHKNPVKQKKDLSKIEFLAALGILMLAISDDDTYTPVAQRMIKEIVQKERLDHRGTQRVWHRVWLSTIAAHATDEEFQFIEKQLTIKSTN